MKYACIRLTSKQDKQINLVVPWKIKYKFLTESNAEIAIFNSREEAQTACDAQSIMDDFHVTVKKCSSGRWAALDPYTEENLAVAETLQDLRRKLGKIILFEGTDNEE